VRLTAPVASPAVPTVWRLHLRSQDLAVDHREQVEHCVRLGIGAVGWPLDEPAPTDLDDCLSRTRERWGSGGVGAVRRLGREARDGDLVWARDLDGSYLLGEVVGAVALRPVARGARGRLPQFATDPLGAPPPARR
jgi:hypothetical protein